MHNFAVEEQIILKFWQERRIFEKLREQISGKKKWSFVDGPITANNPMGIHHAWGRTYKDVFQRFKAMRGFDQRFQNGFDAQGLWIEREEEKDLGLKTKEDIEKYGIEKYVDACKARVQRFAKLITADSIRLGQWMDWDNSYFTNTDENNLHNWFLLKKYFEKGWLYKGKDAVPWCPRCGTASSKHDIITEGYKEVTHVALFMRFPVKGKKDEYFLIFTTTPWTVPANVALAVNSKLNYVKAENEGKKYWIVESQTEKILKGKFKIIEKKTGKQLVGLKYEMPYAFFPEQKNSPHKVVSWELASAEEGTGIVHIAPGCGAEDYDLGKRENLPAISPLNEAGFYYNDWENFSGKKYSEVNKLVLKDLEEKGFVYKIEPYKHRYPHCFRCGEELVFRLVDEWYIKADEIREKLKLENEKIMWFPEYGRKRQSEWFDNMSDWLISRKRYYGLPLPIWECSCGELEVIGSLEELKEKAIKGIKELKEIHRPWIDNVFLKCKKCGKEMKRVSDVGDAWLDAGIVPFSTIGPYLKNKKEWEKWFPADFICENMPGQYRGWFNALFWASVAITEEGPFKAILGYETVKDENGREMHKSLGNAIWAKEALEKIGADPLRLTFCLHDPDKELWFGWNTPKDAITALNVLWNLGQLLIEVKQIKKNKSANLIDKWIISRLNTTIKETTQSLEKFKPHLAAKTIVSFWLDELSRGYIQFIRERLGEQDKEALSTFFEVYLNLIKLCSPMIPFITELIYQNLKEKFGLKQESIHLCEWPKYDEKMIDEKLEQEMSVMRQIIEKIMAARAEVKINVRWPLAAAEVSGIEILNNELQELIKKQCNLKKIIFKKSKEKEISVKLDTKMSDELEAEGFAREIARRVQEARKKASLRVGDKIELVLQLNKKIASLLEKFEQTDYIEQKTNAVKFEIADLKKEIKGYKNKAEDKIRDDAIVIFFNKINS